MAHSRIFYFGAVLIVAAVWIVYAGAVSSPFVFDDEVSVLKNPSITRTWPLVGNTDDPGPLNPPKEATTSGRPLVNLSLAVNYALGGLNPAGYHVFNIVVHILSALVLMAIVVRTLRLDYFGSRFEESASWIALAAALLWAVHPLQTETVVYVTQRTELLVGLFYLTTLYASLRYWPAVSSVSRKGWVIAATLACMAGMASKEVMVTAPVVVLLFERTFLRGSFKAAVRQSWPLYIGLALGWGLLFVLNVNMPRSLSAGFHLGLPAYVWWLTQTKVLLLYLKVAVWPWPLSIHYEMPYLTTVGGALVYLVPIAVLAIGTLLLVWRRNAVGFVGAWVLVILSPTLVVPIITEVAAERRMYLPLAALVTLAVVGAYEGVRRIRWREAGKDTKSARRMEGVVCCVVVTLMAIGWSAVSIRRLEAYRSAIALWQNVLESHPDDFIAHYNLGNALAMSGHPADALVHYRETMQLQPGFPDSYNNVGNVLLEKGDAQQALEYFKHAVQLKPDYAEAHNNLGKALAVMGMLQEAIAEYRESIRLKPSFADAHNNLANALLRTEHRDEAIEQYELALRLNPEYSTAHANFAAALASMGRMPEAIEQYQAALRINPDNFDALANLALTYAALGRHEEAIGAAEKALQLARAHGDMGLAQQIESWLTQYRGAGSTSGSVSPQPGAVAPAP